MEFQCHVCRVAFAHPSPLLTGAPNRFSGFSGLPKGWQIVCPDPQLDPSIWRFVCSGCSDSGRVREQNQLEQLADDVHAIRRVIAPRREFEHVEHVQCSNCRQPIDPTVVRSDTRNMFVEIPTGCHALVDSAPDALRMQFFHEICPPERKMTDELVPGQRIITEVAKWIGTSLDNRGQELREFIARGIDDPAQILDAHVSDCALFALAVWHCVGVDHPLCRAEYVTGKAMQWIEAIARDRLAIRFPKRDGVPKLGSLMHYYSHRPSLDDHVEFLMSEVTVDPDIEWSAQHAGGGRTNCAIGTATSDIRWNFGRPLQCWYDPEALLAV